MKKILIATDLDRTLLPNGNHKLSKGAINSFKILIKKTNKKIILIYITGRNKTLILQAIKKYNLPKPEFCISMVGSVIYKYEKNSLIEDKNWENHLKKSSKNFNSEKIISSLKDIKQLKLQPKKYLNDFKVSYYLKNKSLLKSTLKKIKLELKKNKINAKVIYSFDVNRKIGLIDVMHKNANKLSALYFLLDKLKIKKQNIVYCGDSGNDLEIFKSGIKSILVKNASYDFKEKLKKEIKKNKKMKIYFARGNFKNLNGNYVSGILEGINHYKFV
ncbi:MAG: HAD-IIB family hydrolase [Candidatus Pacearchaeota archaeon]|jgi:sucrose-6F-phosphate phosphohydrolase